MSDEKLIIELGIPKHKRKIVNNKPINEDFKFGNDITKILVEEYNFAGNVKIILEEEKLF